ncbi:hypothetical protein [Nocardia sp. 348MFTsu5.1]|uniref:hypothetical protein n=1 Tax=Nocardia sp. 348MFTsu5.1 TaxID=1172185 RepID=UPI00037E6169|nr:hypothetical protein [Nocardia sp. 348MFTsu5.1]
MGNGELHLGALDIAEPPASTTDEHDGPGLLERYFQITPRPGRAAQATRACSGDPPSKSTAPMAWSAAARRKVVFHAVASVASSSAPARAEAASPPASVIST